MIAWKLWKRAKINRKIMVFWVFAGVLIMQLNYIEIIFLGSYFLMTYIFNTIRGILIKNEKIHSIF